MGLGALTASCAIAKAVLLKELFAKDYTWSIIKPAICTVLEHLLGIVIASVPALKPLFSRSLYAAGSTRNSSGRSFPKILGTGGSTPPQSTSLEDRTGAKEQSIPLNGKRITKTTEFYLSIEQYLDTSHHSEPTAAWPIPDLPAPPSPAKEKNIQLLV